MKAFAMQEPAAKRPPVNSTFEPEPQRGEAVVFDPHCDPPPAPPPPPCREVDRDYDDLEAAWGQLHAMGGWASLDDYGLAIPREEDEPRRFAVATSR